MSIVVQVGTGAPGSCGRTSCCRRRRSLRRPPASSPARFRPAAGCCCKKPRSLMPATLSTARRTFSPASIWLAYGPSETPVRAMDVAADQHQVRAVARREQVGHRQRVGHHLQRPPDQQPRQLVGRAAAVEQDRVAVLDQLGWPRPRSAASCPSSPAAAGRSAAASATGRCKTRRRASAWPRPTLPGNLGHAGPSIPKLPAPPPVPAATQTPAAGPVPAAGDAPVFADCER